MKFERLIRFAWRNAVPLSIKLRLRDAILNRLKVDRPATPSFAEVPSTPSAPQISADADRIASASDFRRLQDRAEANLSKLRNKHKTQLRAVRAQSRLMRIALDEASSQFEWNALSPGRADWSAKWKETTGRRILYFTFSDFSGSFYRWAEAVNRETPHAVRMISLTRHRYGYPLDLLFMRGHTLYAEFPDMFASILELADQADVIHIKDQTGFFDGHNGMPKDLFTQFGKPIVYTFYGGNARWQESEEAYRSYVLGHQSIIAMTPDLYFDWLEGYVIPHTIDTNEPPSWRDGNLLMHTPSRPERKGTDMFTAAANACSAKFDIETEVISNSPHSYVMDRKKHATLFFDQAGKEGDKLNNKVIGWYGNSALEAAVLGVPTIAHLSDDAISRAERSGYTIRGVCPIINTEPSQEGLEAAISGFFSLSAKERSHVSSATRKWIEDRHSYQATASRLARVYESL